MSRLKILDNLKSENYSNIDRYLKSYNRHTFKIVNRTQNRTEIPQLKYRIGKQPAITVFNKCLI